MNVKSRILIVNPLFRNLFISNCKDILKDKFEIDEFFIKHSYQYNKFTVFYHKIVNLFNIHFLKKRDYYKRLEERRQNDYYQNCLENISNNHYEKILFCRGDRIPTFVLAKLSKQAKEIINYQCDGVKMCPDIFQKKDYFTKIYSFEKDDIINYPDLKMDFITNFYFKNYNDILNEIEYDFYYLGVGIDQRIKILSEFDNLFSSYKKRFLLSGSKLGESNDSIEYFINPIDYKNNLLEAKKAFCLIDLKLESHNGLSFRFYESLYFQKKLITNNKDVVNYDFYNSNNILIVDYDNLIKDDIEKFLQLEYIEINQNIVEKYSFDVWLKQILNIN